MDLLPSIPQYYFLTSDKRITLFVGGIGSGKTWTLVVKMLELISNYPKAKGFIAANTYRQLQKATLAGMFKVLDEIGIVYEYIPSKATLTIAGTEITCGSMEQYENWRGIEIGWLLGDEVAFWDEEAMNVILGRLRDNNGPKRAFFATSPNGLNYLYTKFVENKSPDVAIVYSKTYDNKHLDPEYIRMLESQYDPLLVKQELHGEFINLAAGAVYRSFDMAKHVKDFDTPRVTRLAGQDFNVNPMCSVCAFVANDIIYIYDEIWLEHVTTYDLVSPLIEKVGDGATIYADASGKARKTSATKSDHQILKDSGFVIKANPSNPAIRDRQNCVNGLLHNGRIVIHPRCKRLIRDLNQFSHDNKKVDLGHITDALGYLAWGLYPLKKPVIGCVRID